MRKKRTSKKLKPTANRTNETIAVLPHIEGRIIELRGQRVLMDEDLATLYGTELKALLQSVKRNNERFPEDFAFQLSPQDLAQLRSQIVISKKEGRGGRRTAPYAFTEQGVAMLSSVLHSPRAVAVNVEIMRIFVRIRALAATHSDLAKRLADLEQQTNHLHSKQESFSRETKQHLQQVFDALRELMTPPPTPPKRPMGFITPRGTNAKRMQVAKSRAVSNK
jgi:hypothetical protein